MLKFEQQLPDEQKLKDRLDILEAEMTALKDDMATQI